MVKLKIDPEFRDKLPPLSEKEFEQLRANILEAGRVKRELTVWHGCLDKSKDPNEYDYLIDGHNRWRIICENWELLKDQYAIEYKDFPNKWAAVAWMYRNQLGQRNLSDLWQDKINGEIVKAEIKAVGATEGHVFYGNQHGGSLLDTSEPISKDKPKSTVERVAKELNVPEGTLKKQLAFVRGLDAGETVSPGFQEKVLSGEVKASKAAIRELRNMEPEEIEQAVEEIYAGRKPTVKEKNQSARSMEERDNEKLVKGIVADMYNPDSVPEFTIDFLIEDIQANGENYIDLLRNTLTDRSTLLTKENKPRVAAEIQNIIDKIYKLKELVEK